MKRHLCIFALISIIIVIAGYFVYRQQVPKPVAPVNASALPQATPAVPLQVQTILQDLSQPKSSIEKRLGAARHSLANEYGADWSFYYSKDSGEMSMYAYEQDRVIAGFSNRNFTATQADVRRIYHEPLTSIQRHGRQYEASLNNGMDTYLLQDPNAYVTFFYDVDEDMSVKGILFVRQDVEEAKDGYYGSMAGQVQFAMEQQLFLITNAIRQQYGLSELSWSAPVAKVARAHSNDMVQRNYFAHADPDGVDLSQRLAAAKIPYTYAGENIAKGVFNPIYAAFGFLNSPEHRIIMLSASYHSLGVGIAVDHTGLPFFTENYLRK